MKTYIYHIVLPDYWQTFKAKDNYTAATFEEEGFIHCCTAAQIQYVLTTYFKGVPAIVLLKIDPEILTSALKIEPANGHYFPHIYGAINKNAIVEIKTIPLKAENTKAHSYTIHLKWTGNLGKGTKRYTSYSRDHEIKAAGKPIIFGSSDPSFRGDPSRYNPEDLFVSTLSSCHMLWYLHLCTIHKITVTAYEDNPVGVMLEEEDGSGQFEKVTLNPVISIKESDKLEVAKSLHQEAHKYCFIANSVNFEVLTKPIIKIALDA